MQQLLAEAGNAGVSREMVSVEAKGTEAATDFGSVKSRKAVACWKSGHSGCRFLNFDQAS